MDVEIFFSILFLKFESRLDQRSYRLNEINGDFCWSKQLNLLNYSMNFKPRKIMTRYESRVGVPMFLTLKRSRSDRWRLFIPGSWFSYGTRGSFWYNETEGLNNSLRLFQIGQNWTAKERQKSNGENFADNPLPSKNGAKATKSIMTQYESFSGKHDLSLENIQN